MQYLTRLVFVLSITLLVGFLFVNPAKASAFTLSGSVTNELAEGLPDASVEVIDASTHVTIQIATTNSEGDYTADVSEGVYNIQVTPVSTSGYQPAVALMQHIDRDKVVNFILVTDAEAVTLSGRVLDAQGNGVSHQNVAFGINSVITDESGVYFIQAASGDGYIRVSSTPNDLDTIPDDYMIGTSSTFSLTQNTTLDLQLPLKKIDVHVQDPAGDPVAGATISTDHPNADNLTLAGLPAGGNSSTTGVTNEDGDVSLWLFFATYSFTALPPSGSIYASKSISDVLVTDNTVLTIVLPNSYTLSGKVLDAEGNGVPGQQVGFGADASVTLESGYYSIQTGPEERQLTVRSTQYHSGTIPKDYMIGTSSTFSLTQNTTLDLQLPLKKIDVHVQDPSGNPVIGAIVSTDHPNSNNLTIGGLPAAGNSQSDKITDENGNASLWLFPATYAFTVVPPDGSDLASKIISDVTFTENTSISVVLPIAYTLSGKVQDALGNGVPHQRVNMGSNEAFTDDSGHYSLQVSPGDYQIRVSSSLSNNISTIPQDYMIGTSSSFSLTQNATLDLQLPLGHVTVHVQDPAGDPVAGATISTDHPNADNLTLAGLPAGGNSMTAGVTNENGDVSLWLFSATYSLTASPPSEGIYAPFTLNNVVVTGDQTEVIALQYLNPPTNAEPVINEISVSPNPVQINASTTATAGFTDPDTNDTHTALWDWGDGSSSTGTVTESNGSGSVTDSHIYSTAGDYTITLTVTDNNGAAGARTATVTVYAVPTDNDQCKKDGWKNFPFLNFKNQGDCVSYVATHGKNPPSGN